MAEKRQRATMGDELTKAREKITELEIEKARLQAAVYEARATNDLILGAIEQMKKKLAEALG